MRETWKNGTKVKFIDQDKYDNREHTILNVQELPNDVCYFLHYWSWIDEDELELVDMSKMSGVKVGDYFNDGKLFKIIKIVGNWAFCDDTHFVSLEYAYAHRVSIIQDTMKEDVVIAPSHYTTTKISALDVVNDWELDFYLGNVLKYIKRHELKGNAVQDLKKAAQYLQLKINLLEKNNG